MSGRVTTITITKRGLRMLLHWAAYGVTRAHGGTYEDEIVAAIRSYAKQINYQVSGLEFGTAIPKRAARPKR